MKDEIWECKDGRSIAVGDMSEAHVRNTLRMILRARRRKEEIIREALAKALAPLSGDEEAKWGHS
jgi:hypothetical protein